MRTPKGKHQNDSFLLSPSYIINYLNPSSSKAMPIE